MVAICTDILINGACTKAVCGDKHDVQICRHCGVVCYSTRMYEAHLGGQRHKNRISGINDNVHCSICDTNLSKSNWEGHIHGKRHVRLASQQGVRLDVEPEEATTLPGFIYCPVCKSDVQEGMWNSHTSSRAHARKILFTHYEAAFEEAEKNKHGVTISHDHDGIDFGIAEVKCAELGVSLVVKAQNTVPLSKIT